jgi:NMD protein affecting ribosome stability and mRNA decay
VSCSDCSRARKKTFHATVQEFPEVGSFRTILEDTAISIARKWREHKSFQEYSLSSMVYVYVDFKKAQKATEMCGTV